MHAHGQSTPLSRAALTAVQRGAVSRSRYRSDAMTAKEKLRQRIEGLSEHEAEQTLRLLDMRQDPMIAAFMDAPEDDEPLSAEEEAALKESRAEHGRGESVPLDEIRHEFS
jgi:hypothetical protein